MHKDINVNVSGPMQPTSTYKTVVLKGQAPFAAQVTEPNTKYIIKHDFVLDGDVTVPANCVLEFDGGSLSNGTLIGNGTKIHAPSVKIFNSTISFGGTWYLENVEFCWFGPKKNNSIFDCSTLLCKAIQLSSCANCTIIVESGIYYFLNSIDIDSFITGEQHVVISIEGDSSRKDTIDRNENGGTKFMIGDDNFMYSSSGNNTIQGGIKYINFFPIEDVYDNATVFNTNLRHFHFMYCSVRHFKYFVHGVIAYVSTIECNEFLYLKHFVCGPDGENVNILVDSVVTNNYINGSVKDSCMFYGGYLAEARVENNFIDFFKYIVGANDNTDIYIRGNAIFANNIFDYCYSFCDGIKKLECLVFTGNALTHCCWNLAKYTWFWNSRADDDIRNNPWVFFRIKNEVKEIIIESNYCSSDFLFVADYNSKISSVKVKGNVTTEKFPIYIGVVDDASDKESCDIDNWAFKDNYLAVPLHFIKMAGSYDFRKGSAPVFVPNYNILSPEKLYEEPIERRNNNIYLNYNTLNNKWARLFQETSTSYVTYYNDTILCVRNKTTEKVEQCLFDDAVTLYNAGLIEIDDTIYISDLCIYLKVTGIVSDKIDGNVIGDIIMPDRHGVAGVPFIKDANVANNRTVIDNGTIKRYNNTSLVAVTDGTLFYFKKVADTLAPSYREHNHEVFFDKSLKKLLFVLGGRLVDVFGFTKALSKGTTSERPLAIGRGGTLTTADDEGFYYFDKDLKKPIYAATIQTSMNVFWKESDGATAGVARSGASTNRPVGSSIYVGFQYQDTTLGKPIFANAISGDTVTWVDATGTPV